ncbi:MAG TPA: DUF998 domain-containing protein [Acidimicrobiales bacterium]|nr:DUF998 domain-containing protein [Acidimicrobiales bacterium]
MNSLATIRMLVTMAQGRRPVTVAVCTVAPTQSKRFRSAAESDKSGAAAWGGLAGPAAFAGAWLAGSIVRKGYDPVQQAISRLAEDGASTQGLMTAGFVGFSAGVMAAAPALARCLGRPAGVAAAATALATAGVALTPLRGDAANSAHNLFAVTGYATLAATPLLAARSLARRGLGAAAMASVGTGVVTAALLASTATGWSPGLFQRLGLTCGHAWVAWASAAVATRRIGHWNARG